MKSQSVLFFTKIATDLLVPVPLSSSGYFLPVRFRDTHPPSCNRIVLRKYFAVPLLSVPAGHRLGFQRCLLCLQIRSSTLLQYALGLKNNIGENYSKFLMRQRNNEQAKEESSHPVSSDPYPALHTCHIPNVE